MWAPSRCKWSYGAPMNGGKSIGFTGVFSPYFVELWALTYICSSWRGRRYAPCASDSGCIRLLLSQASFPWNDGRHGGRRYKVGPPTIVISGPITPLNCRVILSLKLTAFSPLKIDPWERRLLLGFPPFLGSVCCWVLWECNPIVTHWFSAVYRGYPCHTEFITMGFFGPPEALIPPPFQFLVDPCHLLAAFEPQKW